MVGCEQTRAFSEERQAVRRAPNTDFEEKNLMPTVKLDSRKIIILGCISAFGTGKIVRLGGAVESERYQGILNKSVLPCVRKLRLCQGQIFQQDNQPNIKANLKKYRFGKKIFQVKFSDRNPIENIQFKLKKCVHTGYPVNIEQMREFCLEECSKYQAQYCHKYKNVAYFIVKYLITYMQNF